MKKYENVQSAIDSLYTALSEYRAAFEEAFGDAIFDRDGEDYLLLYPLADLLEYTDSLRSESVDLIKKKYAQFREKSLMYLHELRDGIDENDPRRSDLFWDRPWDQPGSLERETFDDSHVSQSLIKLRGHPLFEKAISAASSDQFFSDATAYNEPMRGLLNPELHTS